MRGSTEMIRAAIGFSQDLLRAPVGTRLWVGLLVVINAVGGSVFIRTLEGRLTLGTLMVGGLIMSLLHQRVGMVRLLGVGHVFWLGLVPWLVLRLDGIAPGPLRAWIWTVLSVNSVSLVIDVVDVARYLRGDRKSLVPRPADPA